MHVAYTRRSSEEKTERIYSLTTQINMVRQRASIAGVFLHQKNIYTDKSDGVYRKQSKLKNLINQASLGKISTLFVSDFSRFGESLNQIGNVIKTLISFNIRIIAVEENFDSNSAEGKYFTEIITKFSDILVEKPVIVVKKEISDDDFIYTYTGKLPYGFQRSRGKIVRCKREYNVAKQIVELRDQEDQFSFGMIVDFLKQKRLKTKYKKEWKSSTVRNVYMAFKEMDPRVPA